MRARKQALLEAADRLFRLYGPQKTTIGDIARATGVGVGTVYLEFPNKDAILLELSEAGHRSVLRAIEVAWSSPGSVVISTGICLTWTLSFSRRVPKACPM